MQAIEVRSSKQEYDQREVDSVSTFHTLYLN